jgi:hypothetical protein
VCVRGASALGKVLADHPAAAVRVMVIWLPVLPTDLGPPTEAVRRPLVDPRVVELWDPDRLASPRMVERAAMIARSQGQEPPLGEGDIAWDVIALFPAGVVWEDPFPMPSWYDGPVEHVLEPVAEQLGGAR